MLDDERIPAEDVQHIDVATYRIAAEHASTGWDDFASAQLSFPYLMGLALKFRSTGGVRSLAATTRSTKSGPGK